MWLAAGVFSFGASAVIGYHQDQLAAQNVLTEKVELPQQVLIQDFDPGQHSNILNEVKFLAEVGLSQIVTFNIGTEEVPNWVQGAPIYPVGSMSLPYVNQYLAQMSGDVRRPMPRSEADALAADKARIQPLENQPMGIVLIEPGRTIEDTGLLNSLGDGLNGPLIATTGALLDSQKINAQAVAALSDRDVSALADLPLIVPYFNGVRAAGQTHDYSSTRSLLEWIAFAFTLIAVANLFSLFSRPEKKPEPAFQGVEAVGAFPSVFQPIRTQEDLVREEQEASEKEASATRRTFSRITYG